MGKNEIIVTGSTGSIGSAAVESLCSKGFDIVMACRNDNKAAIVKADLLKKYPEASITAMHLDLASTDSILSFAKEIGQSGIRPIGLLNNAGIMNRNFSLTEDGFENTMGTNYMGTYLLTRLIMPLMPPYANIVNTVSIASKTAKVGHDFFNIDEKKFGQIKTYGNSKLAVLYFTLALAQKTAFRANMADPGIVDSKMIHMNRWFDPLADVLFRPFCNSPQKGAIPAVNAILSNESGMYFVGNTSKSVNKKYLSQPKIEWLWKTTEHIFEQKGIRF